MSGTVDSLLLTLIGHPIKIQETSHYTTSLVTTMSLVTMSGYKGERGGKECTVQSPLAAHILVTTSN